MYDEVGSMIKKLIPDYYFKSIYEIPYDKLYAKGIRLILTDLDNTLISYKEQLPNEKLFAWKNKLLAMGFEIIVVSNSKKDRVNKFCEAFKIDFVKFATKPLKRGIKNAIKDVSKNKYKNEEIILLGDQLMTDIFGAKRMKINACLIEPIAKSTDHFFTRINRRIENHYLKKIAKKYPIKYQNLFHKEGE